MGCGTSNSADVKPNVPRATNQVNQVNQVNQNDQKKPEQNNNVLSINSKPKSKMEIFIESALKKHNEYRALHKAEPLIISEDLNKIAQKYAEHIASINTMVHSKNKYNGDSLGENIYWCSGMLINGADMTTSWYDEISDYRFNNPGFQSGTGHFTQVVWKGSKQVGFGYAQASDGGYYGVANYYPAGNINTPQYFRENVIPK